MAKMLSMEPPFGGWFEHILGWWRHNDSPNILFIKYEDMKRDPPTTVQSVASFIGIEKATDELLRNVIQNSSFASMKKDATSNYNWMVGEGKVFSQENSFIRKVGGWREHFNEEQSKHF